MNTNNRGSSRCTNLTSKIYKQKSESNHKMKKTLSIIMPAYNEKNTILQAIERVKKADIGDYSKEIIVVDDGSMDGTRELIDKVSGIKKILLEKNRGKGGALKEGIMQATGDYAVFQDADLEYNPENFKYMLPLMDSELVGVVIGSRFLGRKQILFGKNRNIIFHHFIGNMGITFAWNILYGTNITDAFPCYKIMRLKDLKSLELKCNRFDFDLEMTAKLRKKGLTFVDVPIEFNHRDFDEGKKIGIKDGFSAIFSMIKYRFSD
jgi:glycosyltransferase involved in cell wall biosynthesis